ncbi:hypothetical protein [Clostridium estertheticum]|uniref:hypothetical protein n=1 Tax=Clostridium estertheticum TaxID=238834 RepID=UPI000B1469C4|nr:hypothetical protein [Clostridium estertheticum]
MLANIIMFLCSIYSKKYNKPIAYIKGTGKQYPCYLLYTESKKVYERMDKF